MHTSLAKSIHGNSDLAVLQFDMQGLTKWLACQQFPQHARPLSPRNNKRRRAVSRDNNEFHSPFCRGRMHMSGNESQKGG